MLALQSFGCVRLWNGRVGFLLDEVNRTRKAAATGYLEKVCVGRLICVVARGAYNSQITFLAGDGMEFHMCDVE